MSCCDAHDPPRLVSVVVPTFDNVGGVARLLDALAAQLGAPPFEVIVADDGSPIDVDACLAERRTVLPYELRIVPSERNTGPAGARNRGWRGARGVVVVFTDDDVVPDPGWLAAIHEPFAAANADVVVGRTRPPVEQRALIGPLSHHLEMGHDGRYSTCNIAYRRSLLERLGGFDEVSFRYPNGEDTDLGLRAAQLGVRVEYAPGALVWHDVRPSSLRRHLRGSARLDGIVALVKVHPSAREEVLHVAWFLSSSHKAVLYGWGALGMLALRPGRWSALAVAGAVGLYRWQYRKIYGAPRSAAEWVTLMPQRFVADSWDICVLARSSVRHRTVLL